MKMNAKLPLIIALSITLPVSAVTSRTTPGRQKSSATKQSFAPLHAKAKRELIVARLEQAIPQLMKDGDVPGLSIALVQNGELVWHRGFGVKNAVTKEPVSDQTLFEAASLSKPVFAYAVLKLVDAGKLDLDAPLSKYLPGNYDVGDDPRLHQITARHVLSHTTGFPNWRQGSGLKIYFTPGDRFSYSGEGFVYLARVVEHVTGEKFNDFMKKSVFDPLGMTSSSYVWRDGDEALKTFRHSSTGEPTGQSKPLQANAAASLQTTAQDYGRFVSAILKGTGLKRETHLGMLKPQISVGNGGTNTIDRAPEKLSPSISWGLGWGLQRTGDGISFWHWGDNGNSKAYVVAFERQKLGVVVFANSATGLSIVREIVDAAVGGDQPALAWLKYESYKSPARQLLKNILARGAEAALGEYRQWRKGRAADEVINENQMNRIGYDLLGLKRIKDAIEVFKLNVEDYPQSANTWDSLGEAYMTSGEKEQAIKNYQRSVELNPNNTNGVEALKKLRETKEN
ncbi:MAG TPA: serine hydrolase [Blastocatellia bacterium]|nr:serine hydrolase [Blastocatellia bacterium]